MVIWIIGQSGCGKTYLAKKLCSQLKKRGKKIFFLDGDEFRKKFSNDLKYTKADRKKNSLRIQKFCKYLENQNIIVICSILSIFINHQKKNRKLFKRYLQIYIKADTKNIHKRNNKKIYSKNKNVVGKDIDFPNPYKSNMIIFNDFTSKYLLNIKKIIRRIYAKL
tara:strand:+ start:107 stop:601 length:495 start_codon:yes stop_codon:yes gene_type:complete